MVILFSLVGCQNNNENNSDISISDEEINEIYKEALKIYSWFDIDTLAVDLKQKISRNDMSYFKVIDEVTKYDDFISMMNEVFDADIVNNILLKSVLYINVDGDLYAIPASRGTHQFRGDESYSIVKESNNSIIYKVKVEILDNQGEITGYETSDFILELYDDGKWRFKNFNMVR